MTQRHFPNISHGTWEFQVGLGKFLSTGPEDKNWEQRQAREAMEKDLKMNQANKGSFFANILPKLDFVEVYGQEKDAPAGPGQDKEGMASIAGNRTHAVSSTCWPSPPPTHSALGSLPDPTLAPVGHFMK